MRRLTALALGGLVVAACGGPVVENGPVARTGPAVLQLQDQPEQEGYGTLTLRGLDPALLQQLHKAKLEAPAWRRFFALHTVPEEAAAGAASDLPAVLGSYRVEADGVRFTPSFPLVPGLPYRATFDLDTLHTTIGRESTAAGRIETLVALPAPATAPATVVSQVYPSAEALPENLLKLYIAFSAPMRLGEAYTHLRLVDADGNAANGAFLEIEQELWDPDLRRLTLFFDPGRIKRGLRPHQEAGLALAEGGTYRLIIDPAWRDGNGQPLKAGFTKTFQVTAADRTPPNHGSWQLEAPAASTTTPLTLRFPEPLDRALLERLLTVRQDPGTAVAGRIEIAEQETLWRFYPTTPWAAGRYTLHVDTDLEDLAGNNLRAPFDVDVEEEDSPMGDGLEHIEIAFDVAS